MWLSWLWQKTTKEVAVWNKDIYIKLSIVLYSCSHLHIRDVTLVIMTENYKRSGSLKQRHIHQAQYNQRTILKGTWIIHYNVHRVSNYIDVKCLYWFSPRKLIHLLMNKGGTKDCTCPAYWYAKKTLYAYILNV